ncbi:MAG: carboxypeptidase regulatory-like domain-containing protein [Patescibacteria group bacterium]
MTLIDVIVGTSIMLIVFLGIFGAFKLSIQLVFNTKAKAGAIALITDRLEYVRGLPYGSVGTVGGIPAGNILQLQQKALNGITYTVRTLAQYVDAPEDGLGSLDTNSITTDYKRVKVEILWMIKEQSRSAFAVTDIAPHGIESLVQGGTLRVNVFDGVAAPVEGVSVRVINASVSPAIDTTVMTNTNGTVEFVGAPPASNYQVFVSKTDYSSAQTYDISAENPNPNPGNMSVVNNQTSTASFAIDRVGTLGVATWSPQGPGEYTDSFMTEAGLSATTNTVVSGGALILDGGPDNYFLLGSASSIAIAPEYLASWGLLSWSASTPAATSVLVNLSYWNATTSSYTLVPDSVLPGNSVGFTTGPVNLSVLTPVTYDSLKIGAGLATTDASSTSSVLDWTLTYQAGPTPLPNVGFSIHGTKTIGTAGAGTPIYKMNESHTTNASGTWTIYPIEWDTYFISLSSGSPHAISEQCPWATTIAPGSTATTSLTLVTAPTNSLRVIVSGAGGAISGANVSLSGPTSASASTSSCGQVFFSGIPSSNAYTVTVSASGYQTVIETDISVSGQSVLPVSIVVSSQ